MRRFQWVRGIIIAVSFAAMGCSEDPEDTLAKQSDPTNQPSGSDVVESDAGASVEKDADSNSVSEGDEKAAGESVDPITPAPRIVGPVATVNGRDIDSNLFYAEFDKAAKHGAKIPPERVERIRKNILNRLVEDELLRQAVVNEKIEIRGKDVEKAYQAYKAKFKSNDQFENYLKHGNHSRGSIKERIRKKKALERLIEKRGGLNVTKDDVKAFYEKNKRFYHEKEAVRARHILFKLKPDAEKSEEERILRTVKKVQKLYKRGVGFELLAKEFSEGPTGPKGGDLGFFTKGQMVKPFEEVAFSIRTGEMSSPVRTRFGFHLIEVVEHRKESQKPLKEVEEQIRSSLRNKKFFQERRSLLENLRTSAAITNNFEK